jgi:hypothetical protein
MRLTRPSLLLVPSSRSPAVTGAASRRALWVPERHITRDGHLGQPTKTVAKIAVAD